ncbi:TonB-dependent receptor plug domain-containing protein [Aquiflexum sp. LQ15W]|uniref:TonB-dependent receptor n=1 Tax=Cognataquiflexum nitidum TaxID=2922272 RepID=UPI001F13AD90|nr:TonB-dependent receptor plug domain-containing protein [Cognataquiflexum nitidum]MCH6201244.1 TonB-dependent receptor plug domain-containing protein [Cognataquiflexum nitidum]
MFQAILNQELNPVKESKISLETEMTSQDTIALSSVEVFSPSLDKYTFGSTIKYISEKDLEIFQGLPLSDFLQQRTGLFLRQYGSGMLSSLTMRGTSAGHNAVFWNGLPINSPSLGQSDFSILPVGGFDHAAIYFGSGGALYGTDAIGGAVHLINKLNFDEGHQVKIASVFGSFGRWNQQVEYSFSGKKLSTRTRIYRNFSENDFLFRNITKMGTPIERQNQVRLEQVGVMQDLAWSVNPKNLISTSIWWNETNREIQPIMGSNTNDFQSDRNLRWVLDYFLFGKNKIWNVKSGLVRDDQTFNGSFNQTIQYFLSGDMDWEINSLWNSKSGIRITEIQGNLSTYQAKESRIELYQSTNFRPSERLSFSVNLRQLVFEGNLAPFTPSIGGEWEVWRNDSHQIHFTSNLARSFKVPTLNDRFWIPGGNPELQSEKSWSGESSLNYLFKKGDFELSQKITVYRMKVDNWIIWLPKGNVWSPENIREVHNSGLEYGLGANQKAGEWDLNMNVNYAKTRAINQTVISKNDRSKGNQLPFTPLHKFQSIIMVGKGTFSTFLNYQRVGERFSGTDGSGRLEPYQLWDVGGNYNWSIRNLDVNLGFQINNLFNTDYMVMPLRAMPGRNYQLNLNVKL